MTVSLKSFQSTIRNYKDRLARNYYQFRINSIPNPYRIRFRKEPYKILLILSHMRSGSSLLTHILNSNRDLIGYGETHLNYASEDDFKNLIFKVYWQLRNYTMSHQYVLDKVLHDNKFLDYHFLASKQIYCIFLLREPQKTLPSILGIKPHWSEEKAFNYYTERLRSLEKYSQLIAQKNINKSLFITYEQLIEQSDSVFQNLQDFLGTKQGFSESYQTLKTTGIKGIGDSSDKIKAGKIIREHYSSKTSFSSSLIQEALTYYQDCYSVLSKNSQTIKP